MNLLCARQDLRLTLLLISKTCCNQIKIIFPNHTLRKLGNIYGRQPLNILAHSSYLPSMLLRVSMDRRELFADISGTGQCPLADSMHQTHLSKWLYFASPQIQSPKVSHQNCHLRSLRRLRHEPILRHVSRYLVFSSSGASAIRLAIVSFYPSSPKLLLSLGLHLLLNVDASLLLTGLRVKRGEVL